MPVRILVFACAWLLIIGDIPVVGAQNSAYTVYLPLVIRDATYRTGEGTYYNADGTGKLLLRSIAGRPRWSRR